MPTADEARETVLGYFNAWTTKRPDEAYAFLADDLVFWGPTASYTSARQLRPALTAFAGMTRRAQLTRLLVEGDWAAMYYDCELPAPIGTIKIASFFRVERRKIRHYETMFDATAFPRGAGLKLRNPDSFTTQRCASRTSVPRRAVPAPPRRSSARRRCRR